MAAACRNLGAVQQGQQVAVFGHRHHASLWGNPQESIQTERPFQPYYSLRAADRTGIQRVRGDEMDFEVYPAPTVRLSP